MSLILSILIQLNEYEKLMFSLEVKGQVTSTVVKVLEYITLKVYFISSMWQRSFGVNRD